MSLCGCLLPHKQKCSFTTHGISLSTQPLKVLASVISIHIFRGNLRKLFSAVISHNVLVPKRAFSNEKLGNILQGDVAPNGRALTRLV